MLMDYYLQKLEKEEIKKGLEELNLDILSIQKFNLTERLRIIYAIEEKMPKEQIQLMVDPKFNWEQMDEIKNGFTEYEFSIDQVKMYADPKFSADEMAHIRREIQKENKKESKWSKKENQDLER